MQATAAVLNQPNGPFSIEQVDVAEPLAGEIRVAIKAVGICHTDLVIASGAMGLQFPAVLGHEGAGIVDAVGEGVTDIKAGDKVLLTFNSCGACKPCSHDEPAYCNHFVPLNMVAVRGDGSTRITRDGQPVSDNFFGQSSFATLAIANQRNVLKVDDDADLSVLAPLGCGIQTGAGGVLRSLAAKPGESLVVLGAGAVGLSALLGGLIAECSAVIVVEPQESRRALATELGATHVLDGQGDVAAAVRAILPEGADMVIDTSGFMPVVEQSVNMIANRGRIGLLGVPGSLDAVLPVPVVQFITQGGTVRGIIEGDSDPHVFLPELIAHHKAGRLPIERFSKSYRLEDINQAIDDAHHGKAIKAILLID
ncbi:NAD(P)-dependent alcohol dehydrogenase [Novosphingobium sp. MMS21-SN21R]|uniref:NAD(P)-dependent alcohol dehydrogenase n=1 Tax=Novosphingobium sp. MMS21-SN21R TaxID=2969298 RepID=UPI002885AD85|nr:NAD(P)-dependent alcohol dehydrogenase [Novosphingobium sp. MMS21-SN21R]MDT0508447.1 NAD(P)-dependent alcohol dehydrogenase [Novosphingobium sp. MMS21-SN21R]